MFHSSKPLKNAEIDELIAECVGEVASDQTVEFASLHVSQDHGFKVIHTAQQGVKWGRRLKGKFAPARGFVMQLGANTRLLVTNGPSQMKRTVSPLPSPLLIHLHKRSTSKSLDALAEQILKFTSMTWRSTSPAAMPVTIYYSELIAGLFTRNCGRFRSGRPRYSEHKASREQVVPVSDLLHQSFAVELHRIENALSAGASSASPGTGLALHVFRSASCSPPSSIATLAKSFLSVPSMRHRSSQLPDSRSGG